MFIRGRRFRFGHSGLERGVLLIVLEPIDR